MKECNCTKNYFRTAEEYRDHLPCSAIGELSKEEEGIIRKLREEKAFAAWEPKATKDIPDADKIKHFDLLYRYALEIYGHAKAKHYKSVDTEHYCFEAIMSLLGPDIWQHWNKIIK